MFCSMCKYSDYINDVTHHIPVRPVVVGRIGGVYGILGWMTIVSFTAKLDNIFNYKPWFVFLNSQWKMIYLDQWKLVGKRYIMQVRDILNRESAKLFSQCSIFIDELQLPVLNCGEYYCKDLIGCAVITVQHVFIGNVIDILETNANDVLVVKIFNNKNFLKTCLIPYLLEQVIVDINIKINTITVDWNINF